MIKEISLITQSLEHERIQTHFKNLNKLGYAGMQKEYNKLVMKGKVNQ